MTVIRKLNRDIARCKGVLQGPWVCPIKDTCLRHLSPPVDDWQLYVIPKMPESGDCDLYMPVQQEKKS